MTINTANLIALNDSTIAPTGAIVLWNVSRIEYAALRAAAAAADLSPAMLPREITAGQAAKRALDEVCVTSVRDKRVLVRPVLKGRSWQVTGEWKTAEGTLRTEPLAMVAVEGNTLTWTTLRQSPTVTAWEAPVRAAFTEAMTVLRGGDLGGWLSRLIGHHDGVALRDAGGVYFVPASQTASMQAWAGALRAAGGGRVHATPVVSGAEAADMALAAIEAEALSEIERITASLADELGSRAITSRSEELAALSDKVSRYERMFGSKVAGMAARLNGLDRTLRTALQSAMDERDAARAGRGRGAVVDFDTRTAPAASPEDSGTDRRGAVIDMFA